MLLKANGDIGLCQVFCQSDETTVGNVSAGSLSGIIENAVIPALGKYKHFLPVFRKSCQECEAIFTCGGGCYWESGECDKSCDIGYCRRNSEFIQNNYRGRQHFILLLVNCFEQ